ELHPAERAFPTFSAACPTEACVMFMNFPKPTPGPNGEEERLKAALEGQDSEAVDDDDKRREALLDTASNDRDEDGDGEAYASNRSDNIAEDGED
ncbi:hypothetical protein BDZ97DRAFT_1843047, partial [Flammula alnicola]